MSARTHLALLLGLLAAIAGTGTASLPPSRVPQVWGQPAACRPAPDDGWCVVTSAHGYMLEVPTGWDLLAESDVEVDDDIGFLSLDNQASLTITRLDALDVPTADLVRAIVGRIQADPTLTNVQVAHGGEPETYPVPGADAAVSLGVAYTGSDDANSYEVIVAARQGSTVYLLDLAVTAQYLADHQHDIARVLTSFHLVA